MTCYSQVDLCWVVRLFLIQEIEKENDLRSLVIEAGLTGVMISDLAC